jgi:hypothetical protein
MQHTSTTTKPTFNIQDANIALETLHNRVLFFTAYFKILSNYDSEELAYYALEEYYQSYYRKPRYKSFDSFRMMKSEYMRMIGKTPSPRGFPAHKKSMGN